MAISQYRFKVRIPARYKRTIKQLRPFTGNEWDCKASELKNKTLGLASRRNELKSIIRRQLEKYQGPHCAFCGLNLESRVPQIEHIAPKGAKRHPQFTFEPLNLILACSLCNGFDKKGSINTISALDPFYYKCTFNIIHPYFDDPNDHLEYVTDPNNHLAYLIKVKVVNGVRSSKGDQSNKIFELDSVAMTQERYKDALAASQPVPDFESLIAQVKAKEYTT